MILQTKNLLLLRKIGLDANRFKNTIRTQAKLYHEIYEATTGIPQTILPVFDQVLEQLHKAEKVLNPDHVIDQLANGAGIQGDRNRKEHAKALQQSSLFGLRNAYYSVLATRNRLERQRKDLRKNLGGRHRPRRDFEACLAAFELYEKLKKHNLKRIGYHGAYFLYILGYDTDPPQGNTKNNDSAINRFWSRKEEGKKFRKHSGV